MIAPHIVNMLNSLHNADASPETNAFFCGFVVGILSVFVAVFLTRFIFWLLDI